MNLSARKSGYLPTLDGWRALAVFAVIAYHDRVFGLGRLNDGLVHRFGFLGVDLFFAISGLLICSRLLEEEQRGQGIKLKGFYIRRFLRILPPATAYLLMLIPLGVLHVIAWSTKAWLAAMFFYRNYYSAWTGTDGISPYTNHFWSLSVEEHFYLFLPALLILFPKARGWLLGLVALASLAWTEIVHLVPALLTKMGGEFADRRTEFHLTGIVFAALLAELLTRAAIRQWCLRWVTPVWTILGFAIALGITHHFGEGFGARVIVPLAFPLVVLSTVLHPESILGRGLELAPLRFLGKVSYSIYLWQQLFFTGSHERAGGVLGYLQWHPFNLIATLACAFASYYLLEKPFMRLGHRLAPPATPGR